MGSASKSQRTDADDWRRPEAEDAETFLAYLEMLTRCIRGRGIQKRRLLTVRGGVVVMGGGHIFVCVAGS